MNRDQIVLDVEAAIDEHGTPVTFTQVTPGTYDKDTGTVAQTTEDFDDVPTVIMSYRSRDVDGTRIVATDKKAIIAKQDDYVPRVGDTFTHGGTTYSIVDSKTYEVAGSVVAYVCQARDGR